MVADEQDTEISLTTVFAKNVRHRRKWRRWTQAQLAVRAKLHPMAISMIELEKADPRLATVETIAKAFKLAPTVLLDPAHVKGKEGKLKT